jgi:hypothetical protein
MIDVIHPGNHEGAAKETEGEPNESIPAFATTDRPPHEAAEYHHGENPNPPDGIEISPDKVREAHGQ